MSISRVIQIHDIENLVFAGAGVEGTAYVGAVAEFEKSIAPLTQIKRVAGASSGSIMALLIALNLTGSQIAELYNGIDFSKIPNNNIFTEIGSLIEELSIDNNKSLRKILENLLLKSNRSTDLTFGELAASGGKDLHIVVTCICEIADEKTCTSDLFSAENAHDTKIIDVILASTAIPGIFPSVGLKQISPGKWVEAKDGFYFVDGGVLLDLPERVFDSPKYMPNEDKSSVPEKYNPRTLGFIVYSDKVVDSLGKNIADIKKPIPKKEVENFAIALVNGVTDRKLTNILEHRKNPWRTVFLKNAGVSAIDFKITQAQKDQLKANGVEGLINFVNRLKTLNAPTKIYVDRKSQTQTLFSDAQTSVASSSSSQSHNLTGATFEHTKLKIIP